MPMLKAINGLMLYATDVAASLEHYQKLGLTVVHNQAPTFGSVRIGDFLVQFQNKDNPKEEAFIKEAMAEPKGAGLFIYLQVDDVDAFYKEVIDKGMVPSTEPRDWPWGNREFVIRDPDGYKVVLYQASVAKVATPDNK